MAVILYSGAENKIKVDRLIITVRRKERLLDAVVFHGLTSRAFPYAFTAPSRFPVGRERGRERVCMRERRERDRVRVSECVCERLCV